MFTCAGPSCLSSAPPAAADAAATERPCWRNRSPSSQSRVNGNAAPTPSRLRPSVHPSVRPRLLSPHPPSPPPLTTPPPPPPPPHSIPPLIRRLLFLSSKHGARYDVIAFTAH